MSLGDAIDTLVSLRDAYACNSPEGRAHATVAWADAKEGEAVRHRAAASADRDLEIENARLRTSLVAAKRHGDALLATVPGLRAETRRLDSELAAARAEARETLERMHDAEARAEEAEQRRAADRRDADRGMDELRGELREAQERYEDALRIPVANQRKQAGKKSVVREPWHTYY
jgi:predicted RNase H-like nuclease (RuvC/YqgF family)